MRTAICLIVPSVLMTGCLARGQSLPPAAELVVPSGYAKVFEFQTLPTSVQIYTCKASPNDSLAWTGPDPDAILMTRNKSLTVHHYTGPTWEATDGSVVRGSSAKHYQPTREKSVDWLELTAKNGTQNFAGIGFIHRIETEGGIAPDPRSHPCDATHMGDQVRVPYRATYEFYAPK